MKLLLLVTIAFLPCLAMAQSSTNTNRPPDAEHPGWRPFQPPTPEQELEWLTTRLSLSTTQQEQIKPLLVARADKAKAIRDDASLTQDQKNDRLERLRQDTDVEIEAVLTSTQVAEFKEMRRLEMHRPGIR